jgi:hypothetical protein
MKVSHSDRYCEMLTTLTKRAVSCHVTVFRHKKCLKSKVLEELFALKKDEVSGDKELSVTLGW